MEHNTLGQVWLAELTAEGPATRKCLERINPELFEWKPHEKSMKVASLCLMLTDMPKWITLSIEDKLIDFKTYEQWAPTTTQDLLDRFDKNMAHAKEVLAKVTDDELAQTFSLKNGEQILYSCPNDENVSSTLNHWVHHRGQLTVYMRMNNIPVPSIYGPSADESAF